MKISILLSILLAYNGKCQFVPAQTVEQKVEIPVGTIHAHYGEGWETDFDCNEFENHQTMKKFNPFCSSNDESPINIETIGHNIDFDDDDVCTDSPLRWNYRESASKVLKNDHTIQVEPSDAVSWFADPWNNDATHSFSSIKNYCLKQLHFHWGLKDNKGSEHTLNGHAFPVEAHFVHYNCEHTWAEIDVAHITQQDIATAKEKHEDYHELGVIAVWFIITDTDNPVMTQILDAVHEIKDGFNCKCHGESSHSCYKDEESGKILRRPGHTKPIENSCFVDQKNIDLSPLVDTSLGYYTYEGSLTTPPCTDNTRWFILRKYAGISKRQMEIMRNITKPCSDELMAPNYRHVQDNKNVVYSCDSYSGKYNQCRMNLKKARDDYAKLHGYLLNRPKKSKQSDDDDDDDDSKDEKQHYDSRDIGDDD